MYQLLLFSLDALCSTGKPGRQTNLPPSCYTVCKTNTLTTPSVSTHAVECTTLGAWENIATAFQSAMMLDSIKTSSDKHSHPQTHFLKYGYLIPWNLSESVAASHDTHTNKHCHVCVFLQYGKASATFFEDSKLQEGNSCCFFLQRGWVGDTKLRRRKSLLLGLVQNDEHLSCVWVHLALDSFNTTQAGAGHFSDMWRIRHHPRSNTTKRYRCARHHFWYTLPLQQKVAFNLQVPCHVFSSARY